MMMMMMMTADSRTTPEGLSTRLLQLDLHPHTHIRYKSLLYAIRVLSSVQLLCSVLCWTDTSIRRPWRQNDGIIIIIIIIITTTARGSLTDPNFTYISVELSYLAGFMELEN